MSCLKNIDYSPKLNKFINYDKQLDEIINYFNYAIGVEENNKAYRSASASSIISSRYSKISVFEENNKFYCVLSNSTYKRLEAVYILANDILKLQKIFLPYEIEYEGKGIIIISQKKLERISQEIKDNYLNFENKKVEIICTDYLDKKINCYFKSILSDKEYSTLINLINLFNVVDLIGFSNFGFDKEKKIIRCLDLENYNRKLSFNELKLFFEKEKLNFGEFINKYPQLLNLIESR